MTSLGRVTLWLTLPMAFVLPVWIWIGRIVFGVGGWGFLLMMPVAIGVFVALLLTAILSLTQEGMRLTTWQTISHLTTWASLFALGAVMPDFGDTEDSQRSLLTQAFGYSDAAYDLSFLLAVLAAFASLVAWLVLVVSLTAGRRKVVA